MSPTLQWQYYMYTEYNWRYYAKLLRFHIVAGRAVSLAIAILSGVSLLVRGWEPWDILLTTVVIVLASVQAVYAFNDHVRQLAAVVTAYSRAMSEFRLAWDRWGQQRYDTPMEDGHRLQALWDECEKLSAPYPIGQGRMRDAAYNEMLKHHNIDPAAAPAAPA